MFSNAFFFILFHHSVNNAYPCTTTNDLHGGLYLTPTYAKSVNVTIMLTNATMIRHQTRTPWIAPKLEVVFALVVNITHLVDTVMFVKRSISDRVAAQGTWQVYANHAIVLDLVFLTGIWNVKRQRKLRDLFILQLLCFLHETFYIKVHVFILLSLHGNLVY